MSFSKKQPLDLLIVAAHASELKPWVTLGRKNFIIKDKTGFLAAGVGPVVAAFGLTHFLEDYRPQKFLVVGTCGSFDLKRFPIGSVLCAKEVTTESNLKISYTPKIQLSRLIIKSSNEKLKNPSAKIYCPQEITKDQKFANELKLAGHDAEHLEAFALAFVFKKFRIPGDIILGVANEVGPKAHAQWVKNADKVLWKIFCPIS